MDILVKIIQFFLCFTILIGIHEMGHFIMARVFKIRVEKFYIFFDPWFSLFKFKRGNTEYGLGWLPLGGYVKIAGMIDESMDTEQMKQPVKQDEFRAKPAWQRFLVMIAGVVMNVVLAVAIYIGICYTWGDTYFSNADAKWGYNFNEAGHRLGFRDGDRFVSIDGEPVDDIAGALNALLITEGGRKVVVERGGEEVTLDLTLEARCLLVNQRFDGVTGGRTGEGMLSVTAGLAYKFNRRGFVRASNVQPVDVTPYLDRIRNLEENNTDLASKNSVLNDENEKLRNAPAKVVVEQKVSASPVVLFFRIGKATLDSKELTNLEFYVRNAMKLDSDKTFTLIGSADKDTGNRELNQRLSEQRMEYVYDLLKNKYGVAPERLVRKAEGDTNNRFAEPELNRAVIVE